MDGSSTGAPPRHAADPSISTRLARLDAWLDARPALLAAFLYLVAVALRLWYLAEFKHSLVAQIPLMDEAYYKAEAWSLVRGAPPASDVFFMTPLYPHFLSWIYRIWGDGPTGPAAVQLVLGALAAPLTGAIARRAMRPLLAFVTGLAVASFAPLVFFESLLLVEGLVLLGLVAAIAFAVAGSGRRRDALLCGVALGFATLGRGSNLALALPLAAWFYLEARRRGGRVRNVLWFLLGLCVLVAPLLMRNAVRAGRPLLLTANAGFNFYVGNGPEATGIFVHVSGLDLQQDPLTLRYVQRQVHHPVTASETSDYWMARTLDWVRQHPGRTLQLFAWKLLLFWNRLSIPQVEGFEAAALGSVLSKPPFWRSFGFLPLALFATFAALAPLVRRRATLDARQRVRVLLASVALVYGASIALFFVTDRYRVPLLPCLMILATCGLDVLASAAVSQSSRRRLVPLLLLLALLAYGTDPARLGVDQRGLRRDLHVHTALRYAQAQQLDAALGEYRAALALDPQNPDTRDGWARMLGRAGRDSLALDTFRALLRDQPDDARAWYNLGNLYRRLGRRELAAAAYRRSLEIEPNREAAWNHLGEVFRTLGDTAEAAECYRRALAVVPSHEPALSNLAALRAQQGHGAEAEAGWRQALASNPRHLPSLVNLAILLSESGRTTEAVSLWQRVLQVDPGNAVARRVLQQLDPNAPLPPAGRAPDRKPGEED